MSQNLENSAMATWLEFSFHSIPKEGQCRRMFKLLYNCTHFMLLARQCSKFFKLDFNSTWMENSQICKLDLKKQRNHRSNCQHRLDHRKSKKFQKKRKSTSASVTMLKSFRCGSQQTGKFLKKWKYHYLTCLIRNLYAGQEAPVRTRHCTKDWFKIGKGVYHCDQRTKYGLEELPHVQGQGQRLRGATPRPRPGMAPGRSNPTSKERWLHGCSRA